MTQIAINFPNWWGWLIAGMMTIDTILTLLSCILQYRLHKQKERQAKGSGHE